MVVWNTVHNYTKTKCLKLGYPLKFYYHLDRMFQAILINFYIKIGGGVKGDANFEIGGAEPKL